MCVCQGCVCIPAAALEGVVGLVVVEQGREIYQDTPVYPMKLITNETYNTVQWRRKRSGYGLCIFCAIANQILAAYS